MKAYLFDKKDDQAMAALAKLIKVAKTNYRVNEEEIAPYLDKAIKAPFENIGSFGELKSGTYELLKDSTGKFALRRAPRGKGKKTGYLHYEERSYLADMASIVPLSLLALLSIGYLLMRRRQR